MEIKKSVENMESKIIRGMILKVLDIEPFKEFGEVVIKEVVGQPEDILNKHYKYLEGKGYIESRELKYQDIARRMFKLTPLGKDLIEQNIDPDVGVYLE